MKNYRIKELDGKYYPQYRSLFFFWNDIKLYDRASRDWFVKSIEDNRYNGMVEYLVAKDAWGVINWIKPEFNVLEHAKIFIEEYQKYLQRKGEKQKPKYHY